MSNYPPPGGYPPQGGFPPPGAYPGGGAPPPPPKSNKKWIFLGCGCLVLIVVVVGAVIALIGGGVYMLANSEASKAAQAFVQQSGEVRDAVGTPVTTTFTGGHIDTANGVGSANITLSVSGPKGSGTAVVNLASKGDGPWSVTSAEFTDSSGETTDLK